MNRLKNQVWLIGNLGRDPEIREFSNGTKLAEFPLGTSDSYKDNKGEWIENTDWHNIKAWGKTADYVEKWLRKGAKIAVTGKIKYPKWEDKDGNKRYGVDIVANEIMGLQKEKTSTKDNPSPPSNPVEEKSVDENKKQDEEDDLPF